MVRHVPRMTDYQEASPYACGGVDRPFHLDLSGSPCQSVTFPKSSGLELYPDSFKGYGVSCAVCRKHERLLRSSKLVQDGVLEKAEGVFGPPSHNTPTGACCEFHEMTQFIADILGINHHFVVPERTCRARPSLGPRSTRRRSISAVIPPSKRLKKVAWAAGGLPCPAVGG